MKRISISRLISAFALLVSVAGSTPVARADALAVMEFVHTVMDGPTLKFEIGSIQSTLEKEPIFDSVYKSSTFARDQWKQVESRVASANGFFDIEKVRDLILRSAEIWDKMTDCTGKDLSKLRNAYISGRFCSLPSENEELISKLKALHLDIAAYLPASALPTVYSGDLQATHSNPLKELFPELWEQGGYNIKMPVTPLFNQIVLEYIAATPGYGSLDDDQYQYSKRTRLIAMMRTAISGLNILGYAPNDCGQLGLWPLSSGIVLNASVGDAAEALDKELKNLHDARAWASVINPCRDAAEKFDSTQRSLLNHSKGVIKFYRKLVQMYGGESSSK